MIVVLVSSADMHFKLRSKQLYMMGLLMGNAYSMVVSTLSINFSAVNQGWLPTERYAALNSLQQTSKQMCVYLCHHCEVLWSCPALSSQSLVGLP